MKLPLARSVRLADFHESQVAYLTGTCNCAGSVATPDRYGTVQSFRWGDCKMHRIAIALAFVAFLGCGALGTARAISSFSADAPEQVLE